jgi:hypothetical protein
VSRDGAVTIAWGDGEYRFRLAIGEIRELQEKCDAGPQEILRRLTVGTWRLNDMRETIRIGLIGGGMKPAEALGKIARYVDEFPLFDNILPARAILVAALVGVEEEPLGNGEPAEAETEATDASPSPPSMGPAP